MSVELHKKIVDEIAEGSPGETILWHAFMGEPTFDYALADKIAYAKSKGIKNVWLNTNGSNSVNDVIRAGVDKIIFSVDAFTQNVYGKVRDRGYWHIVNANIHHALYIKSGCEIMVQFIITENNKHEAEGFKKYWLSQGATVKIRKQLGWGRSVKERLDYEKDRRPCNWLLRQMIILNNGIVAQCDADYDGNYSAGNINNSTIYEIWNGPLKERRMKHLSGMYDFKPCSECDDWQIGLSEVYRP